MRISTVLALTGGIVFLLIATPCASAQQGKGSPGEGWVRAHFCAHCGASLSKKPATQTRYGGMDSGGAFSFQAQPSRKRGAGPEVLEFKGSPRGSFQTRPNAFSFQEVPGRKGTGSKGAFKFKAVPKGGAHPKARVPGFKARPDHSKAGKAKGSFFLMGPEKSGPSEPRQRERRRRGRNRGRRQTPGQRAPWGFRTNPENSTPRPKTPRRRRGHSL